MPSAVVQGRMAPSDLRARATRWGQELAAAGVNFNFAPVLDVVPPGADAQNEPIGVLMRGYGHDPATVGSHGLAFFRGMRSAGVATSAKHFPGLGRVKGNTDFAAGVVDRVTTRDDPYLEPFRQAVKARVPFVMVALATYTRIDPDHIAVFSPVVIEQLLRDDLGFTGVIVSDDIGEAKAVGGVPPAKRAVDFLDAGGDMIVSKTVPPAATMAGAVLGRMRTNASFRARVDEAVLRILRAKEGFRLLPCGP
jgi:beta-N-acetylhexosaminidase